MCLLLYTFVNAWHAILILLFVNFIWKMILFEGIHYIGEMRHNTTLRHLIDQLTEGQLQWCDLDDEQDIVSSNLCLLLMKYDSLQFLVRLFLSFDKLKLK